MANFDEGPVEDRSDRTPLHDRGWANKKRFRLLSSTVLGLGVLGLPAAFAQEAVPAGSTLLERIVVEQRIEDAWGPVEGYVAGRSATGTKTDTPLIETPQSVSVVTADQIAAQGAETLGGALRYTAGVTGELWGTDLRGSGLQIRGFNVWDEVFYVNGLRMKGSDFSSFLSLEPYGAERIEILRGPNSVLYGQNSPGGIINYVSKRPTDETFREVEVSAGSFNTYQGQFDMGGKLDEAGVWSYRLTGLAREGESYTDYVDNDRLFIAPALKWQPDADTSLTLLAAIQKDKVGWGIQFLPANGTVLPNPNGSIPLNRFVGEPDFDEYNPLMAMVGYEFEHRIDDTFMVRQNARYSYLDNDEQFGVFGAGLEPDGRTYNRYADLGMSTFGNFAIDNQMQAEFDTGPLAHLLLAGVDYQYTDYSDYGASADIGPIDIFDPVYGSPISAFTPYLDRDTTHSQTGIYVQDQIKLENWALTVGGRHDWTQTETVNYLAGGAASEQSDSATTWRAGLVYLSDIGLAPYVSYSTSFLPELEHNPAGTPFEPETGEQYEVGIKYQPVGWNAFITVAAFDLTKQNVVRHIGNDAFQTGEIRSRGMEAEGVASLDNGLDIKVAYAYLDTEITDDGEGTEGNTPYGVPQHRVSLWADYTIQSGVLEGLGLGGGIRYIGETYGDDANSFKVPSVTLFDAAVHYEWQNLNFQLNATNLFNKEYIASCSDAGFGCYPGEGRKITGSMKYRW
ncbi:TonB-dependent siderophore receptor [Mesorhizobium camelthorni]|uniref:TonB-dependent siderophore receptor n=1 Tax=Allomesorhizobium camelthorni TaxID=475069 RepID=A0A6G4WM70_9HYPH|nr:TonB-dependent siderophore receptor [Mesorhizobium camelthorni]NGO55724.1 TonB-dependent siderophore receptor [Mesorhizobium camelthorni]